MYISSTIYATGLVFNQLVTALTTLLKSVSPLGKSLVLTTMAQSTPSLRLSIHVEAPGVDPERA